MHKLTQRSKAPRSVAGPRVGAVVTREGVTVRVLSEGERETLPRATVLADDTSIEAVRRAAQAVAARLAAHMRQPIPVTVRA